MNDKNKASGSGSGRRYAPPKRPYTVNANVLRRLGYSEKQIGKMPMNWENATLRVMRNKGFDRNLLELASVRHPPPRKTAHSIQRQIDAERNKKIRDQIERVREAREGGSPFFNWLRRMLRAKPGTIVKSHYVKCEVLRSDTYFTTFSHEGFKVILTMYESVSEDEDGGVFRELIPTKILLGSLDPSKKGHMVYFISDEDDGFETVLKLVGSKGSSEHSLIGKVHAFIKRFCKVSEEITGEQLIVRISRKPINSIPPSP